MAKISDYGATAGADPNYIPDTEGGFTAVPTVNSVDDIIVAHANLLIDHNFQLQRALMEPTRQLSEVRQKNIELEIENRAWRTQLRDRQKQYESLNEDYRSDRQRLNEELASERAHVQKLKSEVENLTNQMRSMVDPLRLVPNQPPQPSSMIRFVNETSNWNIDTFGENCFKDKRERAARLVEEALEVAQSIGLTHVEGHRLVEYVFFKPPGNTPQELGGVITCWAIMVGALDMNPDEIMKDALKDCWTRQPEIKRKHASKVQAGVGGSALWLPGVGGTPKTETRTMHIDGSKIIAQGRAAHEQHIAATQQPERGEH